MNPPPPRRSTVAARSRWVRIRIYTAAGILCLLLGAIGYKAYGLQVDDADHYRQLARRQHLRTLRIPAPRGALYDSRGRELAATARADSIFASPRTVRDLTGTAEKLSEAMGIDVRVLEDKLASERHFVWLDRHVTPDVARAVAALKLPGIEITGEPRRFYPGRSLAGPVLGFANIDGVGIEGIEKAMNELLEGRTGELAALRDARGRVMLSETEAGDIPGAAVTLTLDRSVQFIAERELARALAEHKASAGVAAVMEVDTGRLLAMASLPTYDPNRPAAATRRGARNRAITDTFEIGSPMKAFVVAAALEAGAIRPNQVFQLHKGSYRVGRKWFRDSHYDDELDVTGILKRSSNVGSIKIAQALGADDLREALVRYRFGSETGIELPGERAGFLRPAKRWGEIGLATVAFGHGLTVTPLQVLAGFAAIANGGEYHEPRIVMHVDGADGERLYQHRPEGIRIIRPDVADTVRTMLGSTFDKGRHGGTARHLDVVGYRAGGKTGTAHKVDPATGGYSQELYLSSFVGFAPLDAPRIAVIVVIDEPRGEEHYGAKVAGPTWAAIVGDTLRYLGVPEEPAADDGDKADDDDGADAGAGVSAEPPTRDHALTESLSDLIPRPDGVEIPDFRGLGAAQVLALAAEHGIEVELAGSGRAVRQSPAAGSHSVARRCRVVLAPGYR